MDSTTPSMTRKRGSAASVSSNDDSKVLNEYWMRSSSKKPRSPLGSALKRRRSSRKVSDPLNNPDDKDRMETDDNEQDDDSSSPDTSNSEAESINNSNAGQRKRRKTVGYSSNDNTEVGIMPAPSITRRKVDKVSTTEVTIPNQILKPTIKNPALSSAQALSKENDDEPKNGKKLIVANRTKNHQEDQRKVFPSNSLVLGNHNKHNQHNSQLMSVVTENDSHSNLADRAGFSSVVTPEVSAITPNRTVVIQENDPANRRLFAETYLSAIRFFLFRLIIPMVVILALFYLRANYEPKVQHRVIILESNSQVETIDPLETQDVQSTEQPRHQTVIVRKKKEVKLLPSETIDELLLESAAMNEKLNDLISSSTRMQSEIEEATKKIDEVEEETYTMNDVISERNDVVARLEVVKDISDNIRETLATIEERVDQTATEVQILEGNMLQAKLSAAAHLDANDEFNLDPSTSLEGYTHEQIDEIVASVDEIIAATSTLPDISTPPEILATISADGELPGMSTPTPRPFIDRDSLDAAIRDQVREAWKNFDKSSKGDSEEQSEEPIVEDISLTLTLTDPETTDPLSINRAARSRGGRIVPDNLEQMDIHLTSPPHAASKGFLSKLRLKAGLLRRDSNPQVLLNDNLPTNSGNRYCFTGPEGTVTLTLRRPVKVSKVTVYIPRVGLILNDETVLPRQIRLIGWTANDDDNELKKFDLGIMNIMTEENKIDNINPSLEDAETPSGSWVSYDIPDNEKSRSGRDIPPLRAITFAVISNQGSDEQTCLYRVHVFGIEQKQVVITAEVSNAN